MIDRPDNLRVLVGQLQRAEWIAIDTEADSLHAYPEKLCLLQISISEGDYLIDTLAGMDMGPLLQELRRHELILHGADYDLRLLYKTYEFVPSRIFDTMSAARLLGYSAFGLNSLVAETVGVQLEKGPQKMNWAQRPLSKRMEDYARNDTRYLRPLSEILRAQLKEKGRLGWLEEVCARLIAECSTVRPPDPERVWRIKGSDRLAPPALAILREIWQWREMEALEADQPPYFVMSHESLVQLAADVAQKGKIDGLLPTRLSAGRRARLAAALTRGLCTDPAQFPAPLRTTGYRLTRAEQLRFQQLLAKRDEQAAALGIDPTLIASRATLVSLARGLGKGELMTWQRELLESNGGD